MAVITISKQFGSGGQQIAARVGELLGYRYFDKELIAQVAVEVGLSKSDALDFSEDHYKGKTFLERLFRPGPYVVAEVPTWTLDEAGTEKLKVQQLDEAHFVKLVRGAIIAAYNQGNVVIVGRGGQVILEQMPGVLHVRLEAPLSSRILRVQNEENMLPEEAARLITERDRATTRYLSQLFGVQVDDPSLYHLILNTSKWTPEASAQVIISATKNL